MHRVLHLISGLGPGGAQNVLARLVRATQSRWEHRVISLADPPGAMPSNAPAHVELELLGLRGVLDLPQAVRRAGKVSKAFRPSIIQGWMYHGNLLAAACSLYARNIPVVWNIRHSPQGHAHNPLGTRLVAGANALLSRSAHSIIFNSARSLETHASAGFAKDRAILIPNGFDTDAFRPDRERGCQWRAQHGIPSDALVFGHAARYHEVKNHAGALQAFLQLASEHHDAWFVMVGAEVDTAASLRALVTQHPCRNRVLLLQEQSRMTDVYNALDVLLLSSFAEAMPNVVGEAMACARPCISTDVGDAAALIGDAGWIARSVLHDDLLGSMRLACAAGREQLDALGERARQRIQERFSLPTMVARYERLYDALHAGRQPDVVGAHG